MLLPGREVEVGRMKMGLRHEGDDFAVISGQCRLPDAGAPAGVKRNADAGDGISEAHRTQKVRSAFDGHSAFARLHMIECPGAAQMVGECHDRATVKHVISV